MFLPAAGNYSAGSYYHLGDCNYWSSMPDVDDNTCAYALSYYPNFQSVYGRPNFRSHARAVHSVLDD